MGTESHQVEILNKHGRGGVIILCDHATNRVPEALYRDGKPLGLAARDMGRHIAWDIGAAAITRRLSALMDVPAVLAPVSRLVIDCNREPDHPTLVPDRSDGVMIPANQGLDGAAIAARKAAWYDPFHDAAADLVASHLREGRVPLVVGMHSFTPVMNDKVRPWHIGFLWNRDRRLAQAMIGLIERETDLRVGDNEPYSGRALYHSMQAHGADHGLPQTTVEVRNDLVNTPDRVEQWARLLADILDECMNRPDVCYRAEEGQMT
ncbi:N-formylglutamate amidohydrolase [Yunchengibacter salinarum]|uniref:N-formylglutamate amidohydrolase n=1 Tax=Yunchengibacter salinarum TaxID=3133399 RepID=UPI0035B6671D